MKSYRNAFLITLAAACALAAGLVYGWWRYARPQQQPASAYSLTASSPANEGSQSESTPAALAAEETPLATLQLSPERLQSIGVKTGVVEMKAVHDQIRAVGSVDVDETRLAYVQVRFPGWIHKVYADSTFQFVRKGQPLFTIYSPDLVTTEQEYLLAKQNQNLLAASSIPGVAQGASSLVNGAAERLRQWEVPAREVEQLEKTGRARYDLEIDSPVSGYITERNALPNMYVQPETKLYTVADLSTVWVYAQVFQTDVGRVRLGDPAKVTVDAYPGREFSGRVDFIWPQVDMTTRTVKVRLVFANPGLKLTPGMFVNVQLELPMGRQLVIPLSGVFQSGSRQIAFLDHGEGILEPREIELGPQVSDEYVVLKGLKAGDRIVTSANFLIDSESQLQAAIGSYVPPPPGAGASAAVNGTAAPAKARLDFSTSPSPPRQGANTVRVKLADANGAPLAGAQVTVTFFMPAMPAMGMAAMRTAVELADRGAGNYQGQANLQSGGSWQVSIVARRSGQVLGSTQLTVDAAGGM